MYSKDITMALLIVVTLLSFTPETTLLLVGQKDASLKDQPVFILMDAQRYYLNVTTFPGGHRQVWVGYQVNITVKNIGQDASFVDMLVYDSVVNRIYESPPSNKGGYGYHGENGEFVTWTRFKTWRQNETVIGLFDQQSLNSNLIRVQFVIYGDSTYSNIAQKQTLAFYFDTSLSVYAAPFMYENFEPYEGGYIGWTFIDNVTISGRLLDTNIGKGIPNEKLYVFYRALVNSTFMVYTPWTFLTEAYTDSDGLYSHVWIPPINRYMSYDIVYTINVVWNQSDHYTKAATNVYSKPETPIGPTLTTLVYVAAATLLAVAVLISIVYRRKITSFLSKDRGEISTVQTRDKMLQNKKERPAQLRFLL